MNDNRNIPAPIDGVLGVIALELAGDSAPDKAALGQHAAGQLATLLGRDLGVLVPGVRDLDLAFAAAHFDPAELLRPGWPVHRRLHELRQRAPQQAQGPRIIAFGADPRGEVPLPFRADPQLAGGRLRVLPYLFAGEPDAIAAVTERMESMLFDLGMVKADTALLAQDAFGAQIEHARYMTLHDLLAMTALQYRNQGLEALWPVLETALLAPREEAWLDAPPEPKLHYDGGEVRIALPAADTSDAELARLPQAMPAYRARMKQFVAVLEAHGIRVVPMQDRVGSG